MRIIVLLLAVITISGCSAMMVGGSVGGVGGTVATGGASTSGPTDSSITSAVKSNLAADSLVKPFQIGVRTKSGKVTLTGTVDSYVAYEQAERIAIRTNGVKSIDNNIQVEAIE